jgi:hypothetical protein
MLMVRRNETLEEICDRALSVATRSGNIVQFEYDLKRYQAEPAGFVQCVGVLYTEREPRYPSPDEEMVLLLGTLSKQMPKEWGIDFAAESPDGSKIVIEKRFQSGVLFDPANRPIRKFRLKEESVA